MIRVITETSEDAALRAAKERRAHREANRLVVWAGIVLATVGVPPQAPQMKALAAALKAVNRAGGIPEESLLGRRRSLTPPRQA